MNELKLIWNCYQAFRALDHIAKAERLLRFQGAKIRINDGWENPLIAKLQEFIDRGKYKDVAIQQ